MLLVSGATRTVRGLAASWPDRLGHLLTPANGNALPTTGLKWAVDNGAYSGFDAAAFRRLLRRAAGHPGAPLWVACPDRVGDARATLALFAGWRDEVAALGLPVALVAQDGQEALGVPWDAFAAWFVGGSTRWKLSQASADLAAEARRRGKWVHVGRVNSLRRLRAAHDMGADSVDGSSMSRFGDTYIDAFCRWLRELDRQPTLFTP